MSTPSPEKVNCIQCGAAILIRTAEKSEGLCVPCAKRAENKTDSYEAAAAKRIEHVREHCESGFDVERAVRYIEHNFGDPQACVLNLASHAEAHAMYSWFAQRDLAAMRNWCYISAKLTQKYYQQSIETHSPGGKMLAMLWPLLSNEPSVITWFVGFDAGFDMKRVEKHKTTDFWAYQTIVALRGDWDRLRQRCELVLSDPPRASSEKKNLRDHEFFLALAQRDTPKMVSVLTDLVAPKSVRARNDYDSGYTADMISTVAVIYAKIAWLHGFEIRIDSPYIPPEWLPTTPLATYDVRYKFLREAGKKPWWKIFD